MNIILQKDIQIQRSYKPENNGMYDYTLLVNDDPIGKVKHSANIYDRAVVYLADPCDPVVELYRNNENIPETDTEDRNTFIIPVTLN